MVRGKKRRDKVKNEMCYTRTVSKTGKWRGQKASDYQKFISGKGHEHSEVFCIALKGDHPKRRICVTREQYKVLLKERKIKLTLRGEL